MTDPIRIPAFNSVTVGHLLARITALEACEEAKRSIYGEPSREMQDEMRRLLGRHQANPVDAGPASSPLWDEQVAADNMNAATPPADDAAVEAIRSAVRVEHPLTRGSLNISSSITEADARKILDAIRAGKVPGIGMSCRHDSMTASMPAAVYEVTP